MEVGEKKQILNPKIANDNLVGGFNPFEKY